MHAVLYTWPACSFCARARSLLAERAIDTTERVLETRAELDHLQRAFGARTLPLVVLDGEPLAGLEALEAALADAS